MNTLTQTIGSLLLANRLQNPDKQGNPQSRPAQAKRLKITEGALRHFETGRRVPSGEIREAMAKLLGVPVRAFVAQCMEAETAKANAAGLAIGKANSARAKARKPTRKQVRTKHKAEARRIRSNYRKP